MLNFLFRITPARLVIAAILVLFSIADIQSAHAASGWEPSQTLGSGSGGTQKLDKAGSEAKSVMLGIVKILGVLGILAGMIASIPLVGQKEKGIAIIKWSALVFLAAYGIDIFISLGKGMFAG